MARDCTERIYGISPLFSDQPNILFVVRSYANATDFELKTNKYVGPRSERPDQLELLDRYDAMEQRFQHNISLFPDKLRDLQGRELIMNGFDYRPYTVIKYVSILTVDTVELMDFRLCRAARAMRVISECPTNRNYLKCTSMEQRRV